MRENPINDIGRDLGIRFQQESAEEILKVLTYVNDLINCNGLNIRDFQYEKRIIAEELSKISENLDPLGIINLKLKVQSILGLYSVDEILKFLLSQKN